MIDVSTHNAFQLVNLTSKGNLYSSVTKWQDERVTRVRSDIYATVVAIWGIIDWFIDILDLVQLPAGAGVIGYLEQHLVLPLQVLHLIMYPIFSISELLGRSIELGHTSIQVLLGIIGVKLIALLTWRRLVPHNQGILTSCTGHSSTGCRDG